MSERKAKEKAKERDNWECRFCGISNEQHKQEYQRGLHAHHVVPSSGGGADNPRNLITVCKSCHKTLEHSQGKALKRVREEHIQEAVEEAKADSQVKISQLGGRIDDLTETIHALSRRNHNMDWLTDELTKQSIYFDVVVSRVGTRAYVSSDRDKAIDAFEDWGSSITKSQVRISEDCAERVTSEVEARMR